ncbi:carboxymuconolactone decarboxylase family protein [Paenarthrobacter ureafaciens]|uniref:carboxymuconolactone decarboxylase family protein n=1 Tax=Paenarthrobacter ureafaciens TaxID=37931 RepID=UPI001FB25617|nr:carboxymuconolactone decarboxylase family protein [Paenarthrobacter ureafaciens]UOD81193.1 carboxymuconolactone decarboxylase family protein [Paenarthrobacter ureafaciens]WNZ03843.1 carboxymuconolactone decarboxylase family protein [Paenarthrobacter ureafaciens]
MDPDQTKLYEAITQGTRAKGPQHFALTDEEGRLNGPFGDFLLSPSVGMELQALGAALRYETELSGRARELAILLVAARHRSTFERDSHEAIARALGFSQDDLEAIRREDVTPFHGVESLVGRTVLALLNGDLGDCAWYEAEDVLGQRTIFELITLVGYYSTLALQLRVFRVDAPVEDPAGEDASAEEYGGCW